MILSEPIEIRTGTLWQGFSNRQLLDLCMGNKELKIEHDENGNLLIISPTKSRKSSYNLNLAVEFYIWIKKIKKGILTDFNGGFVLPDSSMSSHDIGCASRMI